MNLLFITLIDFSSLDDKGIYTDLLRELHRIGHKIFVVSPVESRNAKETRVIRIPEGIILKIKIGNVQKTGLIEKGISTLTLERQITNGIRDYFCNVKFDAVLYSTPPITFEKAVRYIKNRDQAKTYLLLKDIFPQNAIDLGMLSGAKKLLAMYFRWKERKLYRISDYIGCMSPANMDYLLRHNPDISRDKVDICPNCVEINDLSLEMSEREDIRKRYNIPLDRVVFIYGGNLGKPQAIPFVIDCLRHECSNNKVFFLIVGDGTEFSKLESYANCTKQSNFKLIRRLPKEEFNLLVSACDVGLIFLDHRFTIPNFPSRLISYMQSKIPVLVASDPSTDIGTIAVENGFGFCCESNDVQKWANLVNKFVISDRYQMGVNGFNFMCLNYDVKNVAKLIMDRLQGVINE